MFIFTEPYISNLAQNFISSCEGANILQNDFLANHTFDNQHKFISKAEASKKILQNEGRWIYSNSENALMLLDEILPVKHRLRECIELFKNKHLFREQYNNIFPGIDFKLLSLDELINYEFSSFNKPFILKPAVGFLSAGVYRIDTQQELEVVQGKIISEMENLSAVFPKSVLDSSSFILESIITGREFAIDAYYSENNEPVIVNIYEHVFKDDTDMSDRLYITSTDIIQEWLAPFTDFLNKLRSIIDLNGFALHAEVRVDSDGIVKPIEINPLRFAGWCCTDLCYYAYGINPYQYFADKKVPDWNSICSQSDNKLYGMSVISSSLINSTKEFDYEKIKGKFSDLKEIRKIDFKTYPLFGFVFFAFDKKDHDLCNWLLNENFEDFCKIK